MNPSKNPGLAAVLSFFFTGLGQIYNGQIGKGIGFIIIQVINILLMSVIIGFVTFVGFWIFGIYDAYKSAELINYKQKQDGTEVEVAAQKAGDV